MMRLRTSADALPPAARQEFRSLLRRARKATRTTIDAWEREGVNLPASNSRSAIWSAFKQWMLRYVFNETCAYCQTKMPRFVGAAEHYRPKGSVQYVDDADRLTTAMTRYPNAYDDKHPGYFWIAYDVYNLLPSCDLCNNANWEGQRGKHTLFPTDRPHVLLVPLTASQLPALEQCPHASRKWPGYYYLRPLDLNEREAPLLVHPLIDDPQEHISFVFDGQIVAHTPRGTKTLRTFRLDQDALNRTRRHQQIYLKNRVLALLQSELDPDRFYDQCRPVLEPFLAGQEQHAAAALDYLVNCVPPAFRERLTRERRLRAGL